MKLLLKQQHQIIHRNVALLSGRAVNDEPHLRRELIQDDG